MEGLKTIVVEADVDLHNLDSAGSVLEDVENHIVRACEQLNHLRAASDDMAERLFQQSLQIGMNAQNSTREVSEGETSTTVEYEKVGYLPNDQKRVFACALTAFA